MKTKHEVLALAALAAQLLHEDNFILVTLSYFLSQEAPHFTLALRH